MQIPPEIWAEVQAAFTKGGSGPAYEVLRRAGYGELTRDAMTKRLKRQGLTPGVEYAAPYMPEEIPPAYTRRCKNKDCINRFVPVNGNHFFCGPECKTATDVWSTEEILEEEGSLFPEANHLEMAKRAFGQKAQAIRKVTALQSMREYMRFELAELAKGNPHLTYPARPVTPDESDKNERHVILMLSDWQIGKLEDGIGVRCMQENRVPRIMEATRAIVQHFRNAGYAVNKVTIEFGGDMVEGCYIYGGQSLNGLDRTANTHRITRQAYLTTSIMSDVVLDVASYVPEVEVVSVPGNHGRTNGPSDFSDPNDNFDSMCAWFARDRCSSQPNITWRIQDEDWFATFDVFGHKFVTQHGDAWQGDLSKLEKLLPQWVLGDMFKCRPDVLLTHHRHSFQVLEVNGVSVVQNGTIDGGSLWYTKKFGKMSRPNQTVIVASEKRPLEAVYPLVF